MSYSGPGGRSCPTPCAQYRRFFIDLSSTGYATAYPGARLNAVSQPERRGNCCGVLLDRRKD